MTSSLKDADLAEGKDTIDSIFWRLSVARPFTWEVSTDVDSIDCGCLGTRPEAWHVQPTLAECLDEEEWGVVCTFMGLVGTAPCGVFLL